MAARLMAARLLGLLSCHALVRLCAASPFCPQELPSADLTTDLDVIFVQAELESEKITKWPGHLLGAYHTAFVFIGSDNQTWTAEFRAKDFIHAIFPEFRDNSVMDWTKAGVGWCVTKGILHGRKHWSVYQKVARISADDFQALTKNFMKPWLSDTPWSYQLFKVVDKDGQRLLGSLTCSEGVLSSVDFLNKTRGVQLEGISHAGALPQTTVELHADKIEEVKSSEMGEVVKFYQDAADQNATSTLKKMIDFFRTVSERKYMRVSNDQGEVYYRLYLRAPYLTIHYGVRDDWKGSYPNTSSAALALGAAVETPELVVV